MSLMTMRRKMASKKVVNVVFWILVVVFLAGVFLWSVPKNPLVDGPNGSIMPPGSRSSDIAATVNGKKITAGEIEKAFQDEQQKTPASLSNALQMRSGIFASKVQEILLEQAMRQVKVRDNNKALRTVARDIARATILDIRKSAEEEAKKQAAAPLDPKKKEKAKTFEVIYGEKLAEQIKGLQENGGDASMKTATEEQFNDAFVNDFLLNTNGKVFAQFEAYARTLLIGQKQLATLPIDSMSDDYLKAVLTKEVKARWIFIKAKNESAAALDDAKKTADDLHKEISAKPALFSEKARAKSDDQMTNMKGGEMGWLQGEQRGVPFSAEYLAFAYMKKGTLSPVMMAANRSYTGMDMGYAFLLVDDVRNRPDMAKDFDFAKEKEGASLRTKQRYAADLGQTFVTEMRYRAEIICQNKEMQSYLEESRMEFTKADATRREALNTPGKMPEIVRAAMSYQLANSENDLKKKIDLLTTAAQYADSSNMSQLHLEIGSAYLALKNKTKAKEEFDNAANSAQDTDRYIHEQLKQAYQKLGKEGQQGVKDMTKWLAEHKESASPSMMPGMMPPMGQ
ncbi:MAG: peptidylprolyl isomerase [Armatimonadota bacterium]